MHFFFNTLTLNWPGLGPDGSGGSAVGPARAPELKVCFFCLRRRIIPKRQGNDLKRSGKDLKPSENDPKCFENDPKQSENDPNGLKTIRNLAKMSRNRPGEAVIAVKKSILP